MPRKTFAKARHDLLEHLRSRGWTLHTHGAQGPLRTPYATSPDGALRLWFKPQAVYYTWGKHHEFGNARSLHADIRDTSPDEFVRYAMKWHPGDYGAFDRGASQDVSRARRSRRTSRARSRR